MSADRIHQADDVLEFALPIWIVPKGSGAPEGTEYHWCIVAEQVVKKLDANSYTTAITGVKYRLAHKRAQHESWNIGERAQRRRLIKILEELIDQLKKESATGTKDLHEKSTTFSREPPSLAGSASA